MKRQFLFLFYTYFSEMWSLSFFLYLTIFWPFYSSVTYRILVTFSKFWNELIIKPTRVECFHSVELNTTIYILITNVYKRIKRAMHNYSWCHTKVNRSLLLFYNWILHVSFHMCSRGRSWNQLRGVTSCQVDVHRKQVNAISTFLCSDFISPSTKFCWDQVLVKLEASCPKPWRWF